jgi:hypothetical protein
MAIQTVRLCTCESVCEVVCVFEFEFECVGARLGGLGDAWKTRMKSKGYGGGVRLNSGGFGRLT